MKDEIVIKEHRLREILCKAGSALIAYSGGVDSTLLLAVAARELSDRALGVLAVSPSRSPEETAQARDTAKSMGIRIEEIETSEFSNDRFTRNGPERCYFCKRELFMRLAEMTRVGGWAMVADGSQFDDESDARPGRRAAKELGVRSPLAEATLRKSETRALARTLGLGVWDRPAAPCLATRVAFGVKLTPELMERIAEAERRVRAIMPHLRDMRVRHLGDEARIEVDPGLVGEAAGVLNVLARDVSELGYRQVSLAPEGYRPGSLVAGARAD